MFIILYRLLKETVYLHGVLRLFAPYKFENSYDNNILQPDLMLVVITLTCLLVNPTGSNDMIQEQFTCSTSPRKSSTVRDNGVWAIMYRCFAL